MLPLALPRLFGPIWSWEGFLRTAAIRSKKLWLLFCGVLLLTSVIVLCAIQIPAGFWKSWGTGDVSLEDSFRYYQEGMELLKLCNARIDHVEKQMLQIDEEGQVHEFF